MRRKTSTAERLRLINKGDVLETVERHNKFVIMSKIEALTLILEKRAKAKIADNSPIQIKDLADDDLLNYL
jgi:hypothetical protein